MSRVGARSGVKAALALSALMGTVVLSCAQVPGASRAQVMVSSGGLLAEGIAGQAQGQLYREIDDPNLGDRWLLIRNDEFPGGPGHLVRVAAGHNGARGELGAGGGASERVGQAVAVAPALPVIRAGDQVVVEEHSAVVDAVLTARALGPAAVGAAFEVRLTIGGRVVQVVAEGPGRAALTPQPEIGARP